MAATGVKRELTKKTRKIVKNQHFYDSDEEIGWGKVSLKEVKASFKDNSNLLKSRDRHCFPCLKQTAQPTENRNEMDQINKDDSIPAISEYLTASEEVNELENSVCTSNYLSVMESNVTNSNSDKSSKYLSTIDTQISKNNFVDDTRLNFVQKALDATTDDIENEYQTLLECTRSSCNESTGSSISTSKNELEILISSEDESEENVSFDIKGEHLSHVTEESDEKSIFSSREYAMREDRSTTNFRRDEDEGTSRGDSILTYATNLSSPISIAEINLQQFNDSSDSILNNTLDKINAILSQSLSLNVNSEGEENEEEKENKNSSFEPQTKKCSILSSFLQPPVSHTFITEEKHCTPEKNYSSLFKTPTTVKSTPKNTPTSSKSNIPVIKKTPDFRMPELPHKHKSKANFKDIVSPVRMYIKYSPIPILKQTVHARDKPHFKLNSSPKVLKTENKMNMEIPNIVYKPSKKQIFALDESTNLPDSLDKMIKKSSVIKHERHPTRPNVYLNETLNPEAELSKSFLSDTNNLSQMEDVSILHKKTALRD